MLADLADATGLTSSYSAALGLLRPRGTGHDSGRIATDLAVMLADGGEAIVDLVVLRDQGEVVQPCRLDTDFLAAAGRRRRTRTGPSAVGPRSGPDNSLAAGMRDRSGITAAKAGGREVPALVLDIDATLIHLPLGEGPGRTHLQRRLRSRTVTRRAPAFPAAASSSSARALTERSALITGGSWPELVKGVH
uniref:hypothetical protein n=1 Tax=Streptomyces sp. DG1A-41 TaxID=3125779 RepID=UPI0040403D5C